jgi:hypothetical protein
MAQIMAMPNVRRIAWTAVCAKCSGTNCSCAVRGAWYRHRLIDRVFEPAPADGVVFHAATGIDANAIADVQACVRRRLLPVFARHGPLPGDDVRTMGQWAHGGGLSVDGSLLLSTVELIDRIAALIPPPNIHRHRYFGVLARSAAHGKSLRRLRTAGRGRPETVTLQVSRP